MLRVDNDVMSDTHLLDIIQVNEQKLISALKQT